MAISRVGRWAIATDGTFSLGYLTFRLLAGKLDIFSIGFKTGQFDTKLNSLAQSKILAN